MARGPRYFVGNAHARSGGLIAATVHAGNDADRRLAWSLAWLALVSALAAL